MLKIPGVCCSVLQWGLDPTSIVNLPGHCMLDGPTTASQVTSL